MEMKLKTFLHELEFSVESLNSGALIDSFLDEMERGLLKQDSSLLMLPSHIFLRGDRSKREDVIVIDAGGTNLRACLVSLGGGRAPQLGQFQRVPMPGSQGEVPQRVFFERVVDLIEPLLSQSTRVGFCFSYPIDVKPDFKATLKSWTKEIQVPELIGECVTTGLSDEIKRRGFEDKEIVILNDTVACLLAGRADPQSRPSDQFVGFILGTGTNTAYVEDNQNIYGASSLGQQIINVESGGFARCLGSEIDAEIDRESENPGAQRFEKMISGAYLGQVTLKLIHRAIEARLLSGGAALRGRGALSWADANARLMGEPRGALSALPPEDAATIRSICEAVVDRAALLSAVNISAAIIKGKRRLGASSVVINVDGSTYHKTHQLKEKVERHLAEILPGYGVSFRCVHVESAPIIGAALAALTSL